MRTSQFAALTKTLGYCFQAPELLVEALSHASLDHHDRAGADYERLEFLGDRILGLVIAEWLYQSDRTAPAGALAVRLNAMVRKETVARVGRDIQIGQHLLLAPSEEASGGREKDAILADATEALIGALYIDGGLSAAKAFIRAQWQGHIDGVEETVKDPKSRLQELLQGRGEDLPQYRILHQEGPPHNPEFTVLVETGDGRQAQGQGRSKRIAEQAAAKLLLSELHRAHGSDDPAA